MSDKYDGGVDGAISRRGIMLVLSSPSGAGKSTIARHMLEGFDSLELSVSVTTRAKRGSEIDGRHYSFISEREFERLRDSDALLEWAKVHGNYYGSPRDPVEKALGEGRDMLFDIDWQGGLQLIEKARADVVSVFILPPSMTELQDRLKRRAEDSAEAIQQRLANAAEEIPHWREYDYIVVNNDLDKAFHKIESIMIAETLRRDRRMQGLVEFEKNLL
ncbi:MAG: guanylate kinase [Pseudomonadota bacterium]